MSAASSSSSGSSAGTAVTGARNPVTLQQFRAFGMRNISIPTHSGSGLMDLYFKLVVDHKVIYVSEVMRNTLNPVWVPFQLDDYLSIEDSHSHTRLFCGTCFDVIVMRVVDETSALTPASVAMESTVLAEMPTIERPRRKSRAISGGRYLEEEDNDLWQPNHRVSHNDSSEQHQELFHFRISVRELDPLPVEIDEVSNLPLNTCIFEFNGRNYVKRHVMEILIETGVIPSKHSRRKGSAIQVKEYSLQQGIENLQQIMQLRHQVETIMAANARWKQDVAQNIEQKQAAVEMHCARARLQQRIQDLRDQIAQKREAMERLRNVTLEERKTLESDVHIPKALLSAMQMNMKYKDEKQAILERRVEVLRAAHKIRTRQAMLVQHLGLIYPIEYVGAGEYSIRGIKLANADLAINARADEELVSTALGYIAHLVFMLSKYLHVNLRYRVVPFSSKSYVKDEANDPHGDYPLYKKGVEKERYEKAIHYLRKDVEQLLFARGLDPTQGAPILARLKALADAEATWLNNDRNDMMLGANANGVSNGTSMVSR